MKKKYGFVAVILFAAISMTAYGLGKNPRKAAEMWRCEYNAQAEEAARQDAKAVELDNAVSGKNLQKAHDKMAETDVANSRDALKALGQVITGNVFGLFKTGVGMARRTDKAWSAQTKAAPEVADPKLTAQLEKTRQKADQAKKNANTLRPVADLAQKKAAQIEAQKKKAESKPPSSGDFRSRDGIGRGDAKEFHGNDRAAEKASRTG